MASVVNVSSSLACSASGQIRSSRRSLFGGSSLPTLRLAPARPKSLQCKALFTKKPEVSPTPVSCDLGGRHTWRGGSVARHWLKDSACVKRELFDELYLLGHRYCLLHCRFLFYTVLWCEFWTGSVFWNGIDWSRAFDRGFGKLKMAHFKSELGVILSVCWLHKSLAAPCLARFCLFELQPCYEDRRTLKGEILTFRLASDHLITIKPTTTCNEL